MNKKFLFPLSVALNLGLLLFGVSHAMFAHDPELSNYHEWSVLQSLDASQRGKPADKSLIIEKNYRGTGFDAVGIYDPSQNRNVWLLANAAHAPFIKMMPKTAGFTLSEQQVADILNMVSLSDDMKTFLTSSIVRTK